MGLFLKRGGEGHLGGEVWLLVLALVMISDL